MLRRSLTTISAPDQCLVKVIRYTAYLFVNHNCWLEKIDLFLHKTGVHSVRGKLDPWRKITLLSGNEAGSVACCQISSSSRCSSRLSSRWRSSMNRCSSSSSCCNYYWLPMSQLRRRPLRRPQWSRSPQGPELGRQCLRFWRPWRSSCQKGFHLQKHGCSVWVCKYVDDNRRGKDWDEPRSKLSLAMTEKTIAMIPRMKLQKRQLRMDHTKQSDSRLWAEIGSMRAYNTALTVTDCHECMSEIMRLVEKLNVGCRDERRLRQLESPIFLWLTDISGFITKTLEYSHRDSWPRSVRSHCHTSSAWARITSHRCPEMCSPYRSTQNSMSSAARESCRSWISKFGLSVVRVSTVPQFNSIVL